MTYDDALKFIKSNPSKAARRSSWPDEDKCIWWDGQCIVHFRTGPGTAGGSWPADAEDGDLEAADWITDED